MSLLDPIVLLDAERDGEPNGERDLGGLRRVRATDPALPGVRVVVTPWSGDVSERLSAARALYPEAKVVAWLEPGEAGNIDAALEAGADDVVVGGRHLASRLNSWRRDAVISDEYTAGLISYEMMIELVLQMGMKPDLQDILRVAILQMSDLFGIDQVSVVLFKPGQEHAFVVAERNRKLDNLVVRLADYPELQRVIETREPLVIPNVFGDTLLSGIKHKLEEARVRHKSAMLFPLLQRGEVVGALFLRSPRRVSEVDEHALRTGRVIASITSLAIGNALEQDELQSERRALLRDISDADQALADLQSFVEFFEQASDGILVTDRGGHVRYLNASAGELLGRPRDSLAGLRFVDLLASQHESLAQTLMGDDEADTRDYVDLLLTRPAGDEMVISAALRPLRGQGGTLISFRDVTVPREMENELRQTKEFLENLIQSSVDAIVAADVEGVIILFNRAAEQMLGYEARDAVGKLTLADIYPPGDSVDVMQRLRSDSHGGRGRLEMLRRSLVAKSGEAVPVSLTASIIYEGSHEGSAEIASVAIFTDLRERLRIEEKLSQVQRQLQLSERQSVAVELAGVAAHELNQPLTSILGYAELLKRRLGDDETNRKPIDVICRETERMARIVRRIGQITAYKSKHYVGASTILDLGDQDLGDPDRGEAPPNDGDE